jgi:hypothetical protein
LSHSPASLFLSQLKLCTFGRTSLSISLPGAPRVSHSILCFCEFDYFSLHRKVRSFILFLLWILLSSLLSIIFKRPPFYI